LNDYMWMIVCSLHGWLFNKDMNVIVYIMCSLDSPMMSLGVIPVLCNCIIMRMDLHMLIITWVVNDRYYRSFDFEKLLCKWWQPLIWARRHNYNYANIHLASNMWICNSPKTSYLCTLCLDFGLFVLHFIDCYFKCHCYFTKN